MGQVASSSSSSSRSGKALGWGSAVGAVLPGFRGGQVVVNTLQHGARGGGAQQGVWDAEYGLYAQVLAPGAAAAADCGSTAGSTAAGGQGRMSGPGVGGEKVTVAPPPPPPPPLGADGGRSGGGVGSCGGELGKCSRVGGVRVSLGGGVRASSSSRYAEGSMREVSLVVLGSHGVSVQRLEAYEMASMWDPQDTE
jgi:hypothetical protein